MKATKARWRREAVGIERAAYKNAKAKDIAALLGRSPSWWSRMLSEDGNGGPITEVMMLIRETGPDVARDIVQVFNGMFERVHIRGAKTDALIERLDVGITLEAKADAAEDEAGLRRSDDWHELLDVEAALNTELGQIIRELESRRVCWHEAIDALRDART